MEDPSEPRETDWIDSSLYKAVTTGKLGILDTLFKIGVGIDLRDVQRRIALQL